MGVGNFWLDLFLGLFLLAAVLLQRYRGRVSPGRRSLEA
jgi:ribose/xylose/arabinose/galactoside ABC-type transport system permease subunit